MDSNANFIISSKPVCLSMLDKLSFVTKLSDIVSKQAAFLPKTLALWKSANVSISTAVQPYSLNKTLGLSVS